ncbi:MAG: hypothetical protein WED34_13265, partial [Planctomycetales bacterium]
LLPNRLYVPPSLYKRVHALGRKLADIAENVSRAIEAEEKGVAIGEGSDRWLSGMDALEKEADPLFSDMVAAFQQRLGVKDEPVSAQSE